MNSKTDALTRERWAEMEALFDAALARPPDQRAEYLKDACGDDHDMRREVEALLAANDTGGEAVAGLIRDAADSALARSASADDSSMIGPYRVAATLGQGGMGAVYLAYRDDQEFEQKVAIKVLHKTLVTPELQQRFRSERQILADLSHPNIAHLIDGGTLPDGVPYLVMEYIEGLPIDVYCDRHRLTVRQRIELFLEVCSAIELAHQNLIVHRDIKPGNILVTRDGVPKLLDFGIAKILAPQGSRPPPELTQIGDRLLTPDHASPEQVLGKSVTTASDVYSLGVLLYELLCGHRPFRLNGLRPGEMERVIVSIVPRPPSRAIDSRPAAGDKRVDADPSDVAERRSVSVERLRRQLRGDLDNIALHALRKESRLRYRSVGLLADDLRRHLRGLPVAAQPDTFTYRAKKFIGRNRLGVGLGSALAVFLVVFSVLTVVQARRLEHQRDLADEQRAVADRQSYLQAQSLSFVVSTIEAADPERNFGREMTVSEMFAQGAVQMREKFANEPELLMILQQEFGKVYKSLGENDKALAMLRGALSAREDMYGRDDPALIATLNLLGATYLDAGDYSASLDAHRRALGIARNSFGEGHPQVAETLFRLADTLQNEDRYDVAEEYFRRAADTYGRLGDDYAKARADVLVQLGQLRRQMGDFDQAEALVREALAIRSENGDADDPAIAIALEDLALTLQSRGDLEAAGPYYEQALQTLMRVYKGDHPKISLGMANYGRYLRAAGRLDEAEDMFRDALAMERKLSGGDHQYTAFAQLQLARTLREQRKFDEAEALLDDAVAVFERTLGTEHSLLGDALRALGDLQLATGRPQLAGASLRRSMTILEKNYPPEHWIIAACSSDLAMVHAALDDRAQARALLAPALERLAVALGSDHRLTLQARERLDAVTDDPDVRW